MKSEWPPTKEGCLGRFAVFALGVLGAVVGLAAGIWVFAVELARAITG